jgi:hypothetical protein
VVAQVVVGPRLPHMPTADEERPPLWISARLRVVVGLDVLAWFACADRGEDEVLAFGTSTWQQPVGRNKTCRDMETEMVGGACAPMNSIEHLCTFVIVIKKVTINGFV